MLICKYYNWNDFWKRWEIISAATLLQLSKNKVTAVRNDTFSANKFLSENWMDCLWIVEVLQFVFGMKLPVSASDVLIEALFCAQNSSNINSWQSKHFQSYFKGSVLPEKESPPTDCSVVYLSKLFCSSHFCKTWWSITKCHVNCRVTPVSWPPAIGELCVMWHVLSVDPEWGEPWMSSVFIYKNRQFQLLFFQTNSKSDIKNL